MPNDRYTKAVLTVIASALVGMLFQNALRPATAQGSVIRTILCDADDPGRCARLVEFGQAFEPAYALATRNIPQP